MKGSLKQSETMEDFQKSYVHSNKEPSTARPTAGSNQPSKGQGNKSKFILEQIGDIFAEASQNLSSFNYKCFLHDVCSLMASRMTKKEYNKIKSLYKSFYKKVEQGDL